MTTTITDIPDELVLVILAISGNYCAARVSRRFLVLCDRIPATVFAHKERRLEAQACGTKPDQRLSEFPEVSHADELAWLHYFICRVIPFLQPADGSHSGLPVMENSEAVIATLSPALSIAPPTLGGRVVPGRAASLMFHKLRRFIEHGYFTDHVARLQAVGSASHDSHKARNPAEDTPRSESAALHQRAYSWLCAHTVNIQSYTERSQTRAGRAVGELAWDFDFLPGEYAPINTEAKRILYIIASIPHPAVAEWISVLELHPDIKYLDPDMAAALTVWVCASAFNSYPPWMHKAKDTMVFNRWTALLSLTSIRAAAGHPFLGSKIGTMLWEQSAKFHAEVAQKCEAAGVEIVSTSPIFRARSGGIKTFAEFDGNRRYFVNGAEEVIVDFPMV